MTQTSFLILAAIAALYPLTFDPARNPLFALVWLAWVALWGGLALLMAFGMIALSPPPLRLALLFVGQVGFGIALFAFAPAIRRAVRTIPLAWLVQWQQFRVIGGFFIIGAAMGHVAMPFAAIAGAGDIAVGIAAVFTARAMTPANQHRLAGRHMAMGLTDFAVAISTAILTQAQPGWPYAMIPLFLVPMAVLGHLAVLDRLLVKKEVPRTAPTFRTELSE